MTNSSLSPEYGYSVTSILFVSRFQGDGKLVYEATSRARRNGKQNGRPGAEAVKTTYGDPTVGWNDLRSPRARQWHPSTRGPSNCLCSPSQAIPIKEVGAVWSKPWGLRARWISVLEQIRPWEIRVSHIVPVD